MDFSFTHEQKMIQREARRFLEKECPAAVVRALEADERGGAPKLWRHMADMEWMATPFPEIYDGLDGNFIDAVILLEEMGRACLISPYLSSVVLGGFSILEMGSDAQKKKWLPGICKGRCIFSMAVLESQNHWKPQGIQCSATSTGDGYHLVGTKLFVTDAQLADQLIVAARTKPGTDSDGITLFIIDAELAGVEIRTLRTFSSENMGTVELDVVLSAASILGEYHKGWPCIVSACQKAAVAKCAEMSGGARRLFEMSLKYAKERQQFGRPIGSFQAIQHHLANMATDVEAMRAHAYQAAWMLAENIPAAKFVSAAKAFSAEAYHRVSLLAHQIFGAIAFTKEMDIELFVRRVKSAETAFGDINFHKAVLGQLIGKDIQALDENLDIG